MVDYGSLAYTIKYKLDLIKPPIDFVKLNFMKKEKVVPRDLWSE